MLGDVIKKNTLKMKAEQTTLKIKTCNSTPKMHNPRFAVSYVNNAPGIVPKGPLYGIQCD